MRLPDAWQTTTFAPRTHDVRAEVSPFTTIPKSRHLEVRAAVERWGTCAGRRVEITIGGG